MNNCKEQVVEHWDLINSLAVRRFGKSTLAEEAALAVMDSLQENDWLKVRNYSAKSSFRTYLAAVVIRLLEDFARQKFGRVRPPDWLKKLGRVWVNLFKALCLERFSTNDAIETVSQRHPFLSRVNVENAAYEVLARIPDCGKKQAVEVALNEEVLEKGDQDTGFIEKIEAKTRQEVLEAISQIIMGVEKKDISGKMQKALADLKIELSAEERLLLKLCYHEGVSVTQAGKIVGLNRFQVHGKMRRLFARLQAEFDRVGLAEEIRLLLQ